MPFEISIIRDFSAAHRLRLYDGSWEALHGHNWCAKVTVAASKLDSIGVVMDFHELERRLDAVFAPWSERTLNDVPPFTEVSPSAENVALHIALALPLPRGISLLSVEVWETPANSAIYRPV